MWSPDGQWVVFSAIATSRPTRAKSMPSGPTVRSFTASRRAAFARQPSFTPDGTHILVYELTEGEGFEFGHVAKVR